MSVQRWSIARRHRHNEFDIVAPTDFDLHHPVDTTVEAVATNPLLSLYCLDLEQGYALFVEVPAEARIEAAPFYYAAQFEHAVAVVTMPFETFRRVAVLLPVNPDRMVFVYSVGRCGSTLLSAAFRAMPAVRSLSEPDVFGQLLVFRGWRQERDDAVRVLLRSSLQWLGRATPGSPDNLTCVIKFRAFGASLADLLAEVAPAARLVFLYRDARPWFNSVYRAFLQNVDLNSKKLQRILEEFFSQVIRLVAEYRRPKTPLRLSQIWALQWVDAMECALKLQQRGPSLPLLLLRYEDLLAAPEAAVAVLLRHCGLDPDNPSVLAAMHADSQAGTSVARAAVAQPFAPMPGRLLEEAMQIIATRPVINTPNFVLPATWSPPARTAPNEGLG